MVPRSRAAFTLVELLVVVVIIGMLVGLLMPALMGARAKARIVQCTNNQRELGSAVLQYESAKRRLPGYRNDQAGSVVSWVPVLFPYLGRMDLWEDAGWRSNPGNLTPRIDQLVCPDDSPSGVAPLSYVVNLGLDTSNLGVFRNLHDRATSGIRPISMSDIKAPSRRPMISERSLSLGDRKWSELDGDVTAAKFGFIWPSSGLVTVNLPQIHPDVVIVTFCDGHVESISNDAECSLYEWSAIP